jgi:hypothetical protein
MNAKEKVKQIQGSTNGVSLEEENELFNKLTHQERIELSQIFERPQLSIWRCIWVYVEEVDQWILIHQDYTFDSRSTWRPEYVSFDDYVLRTLDRALFQRVESNTTDPQRLATE